MDKNIKNILILGIGNILWADEGFGVRAVNAIDSKYEFPENVNLVDGGTQGLYLLQYILQADILVIFDAIDYGLKPGTLKLVEDDDVPNFLGVKKMSLHQTGFQEVLMTAKMLDKYPQKILLVGVQPMELDDFGGSLHPIVKSKIKEAISVALSWLQSLKIVAKQRIEPLDISKGLIDPAINIESYEQERPSEDMACRYGDERVLISSTCKVSSKINNTKDKLVQINIEQLRKN